MSNTQKAEIQTYIPTIDGLRTLAVMLVVVFHVQKSWLQGGFIGVDIFFVISGFLITRNITKEITEERWSFAQFYLKRVARLFPALFMTVAITLVAAYWIMSPDDLARLGRTSILTILSSSNFFFWLESGYFDVSAEFKPLLHTWSLAVEEQFYMLWPLLVFVSYKVAKKKGIVIGLILVGISSFAAAMLLAQTNPAAVFFLTPFRAYQFALGGLIALIGINHSNNIGSIVGAICVVILLGLGFYVRGVSHHFIAATVPALATVGVIWAARSKAIELILGSKPIIWVGQRSYSIYLVHWPIIVLWKLNTNYHFTPIEAVMAIVISIVAGTILHTLVEKPFRFRHKLSIQKRSSILAGCVALGVTVIVSGAHYWGMDGFQGRVPAHFTKIATNLGQEWDSRRIALRTGKCNMLTYKASDIQHTVDDYDVELCGRSKAEKTSYLILGDSFAGDTYLVMKEAYPQVHFAQLSIPGCHLRLPKQINSKQFPVCKALYELALEKLVRDPEFDGVVLASNWLEGHYYRIDELIKLMPVENFKVVVVGQHIHLRERLPTIVLSAVSEADATQKAQGVLKLEPGLINETIRDRFQDQATFLDFMALQCPKQCDMFTPESELMYLDDSHISTAGASVLAKRLSATQPNLLD